MNTGGVRPSPKRESTAQLPVAGAGESVLLERYRRLVQLAPDGILIHDGEHVTVANAAAAALAGASDCQDLVGMRIDDFLSPPHLKAFDASCNAPLAGPHVPAVRDLFTRLDGRTVDVEVTAIPFVDRGRPAAHLVIRDITERLALQAASRQSEELLRMAEKMDAIGVLAGGVAHEVNNMMVVVLGFCDLLLADDRLPSPLEEPVQQIRNAGERAASVAAQLLSFSRRSAHRPLRVVLDEVANDLAPTLRQLLGRNSGLVVMLQCPQRVVIDRSHLDQVLINLTLNAVDAMPSGGQLMVTTSVATLDGSIRDCAGVEIPAGRYGCVSVQDTGTGIAPGVLSRIFEPFFTTKPQGQGTGLGLAAVFGLLGQDGGFVQAESAVGIGTHFRLYLPLAQEAPSPAAELPSGKARRAGIASRATVLVVDDEAGVRTVATLLLESEGYDVIQASDGASALALIAANGPPDLVLSDVMMPGMNGPDLARQLRKDWPALPLVFMSGFEQGLHLASDDDLDTDVIAKPFSRAAMLSTIAALIARGGQGRPGGS